MVSVTFERLDDTLILEDLAEVGIHFHFIDNHFAGAGGQPNAGNRVLSLAGGVKTILSHDIFLQN
jgi:hypothetical protein